MIKKVNMTRLSIKNNLVTILKLLNFKLLKILTNKELTLFKKSKIFFFDINLKLKIF